MDKSYGILTEVEGKQKICNMISENKDVPKRAEAVFYTRRDKQDKVEISIYEIEGNGQYEDKTKGVFIGKKVLSLNGILPKDAPFLVSLGLQKDSIEVKVSEDSWNTAQTVSIPY